MNEHHLIVPRTARYHTLGDPRTARAIWIVLHGYGHLARYFLNHFNEVEAEVLIAAPEGLSRFYLDEGHTRVGATWMTREDREHEMVDQRTYLDLLVRSLQEQCTAAAPIHVLGFSQGVATACRWAVMGATAIQRLVLWGGTMPPELEADTLRSRLQGVTVELVHGINDRITPEAVLLKNEATLRTAQVPFRSHRFEGAHALDRLLLQRLVTA